MAFNSNGQVQYLVLDSLKEGSKYGLEIIEYISKKTGGNYIMKKPTLYSCLTRMEKKGYVSSSFWGESELGGKRHYYSITSSGKNTLEELEKEFANANYNSLSLEDEKPEQTQSPIFLQQDNLFNLVKSEPKEKSIQQDENNDDTLENQIDIFSLQENTLEDDQNSQQDDTDKDKIEYYKSILEQDTKKDDAKFLDKEEGLSIEEEEQNKRLYDTSNELKKYRKKKSFSENQIEMAVVYDSAEEHEMQRARIEELKKSMLEIKNGHIPHEENTNPIQSSNQPENDNLIFNQETIEQSEKINDDAILITNPRISSNEIPIQKKITPPNIEVNVYDRNLPAPKRNASLEPTYKDMMAKLFEHKRETKKEEEKINTPPVQSSENTDEVDSFVDYSSLKSYYNGHGIEFKEYKKSYVERNHNTNFLNLIASVFLFLLSGISSAILFGIISAANCLQPSSNFLFYTIPILFFIYVVYTFIRFQLYPSKKAGMKYTSLVYWAIFIVGIIAIFIIDLICGMQFETMSLYLTPILVPIFALLIAVPIHYYTRKYLYNKFSK